jgi:hypothetical protein
MVMPYRLALPSKEVEDGKRTRNLLELRKGSRGSGMMGILWGEMGDRLGEGQRLIENESGERQRWVMVLDSFICEQLYWAHECCRMGMGLGLS